MTPEEIRRKADDILARPEYREATPGLVERAVDWLSERLGRLFGPLVGGSGRGGYYLGYIVLLLALAVIGYIAWKVFPRSGVLRRPPAAVTHESVPLTSRAQWLARATEAEAAGRWGEAVHARYHALTTGLADRKVLPATESTTSGEHRAAFARGAGPPAEQVAVFDGVTDCYEHVWFGGRPAAADDSQAVASADQRLLEQQP
ncbi:MAG: DUF4129 domain-containing protein [Acidimicrobiales bacterium]